MKFILILCLTSFVASTPDCHSCFFGVCYGRTRLFGGQKISGQLAVDRSQNIIYFHYATHQDKDHTGMYNLDDMIYSEIPGISFTFARAVDANNRDVYLSGTKGIYKYSHKLNATELHCLPDKTIWHMQYTNKLYYSIFSAAGLNTFENGRSSAISALKNYNIDDFVIDKLGDVYFLSDAAIYRLKNGTVGKLRNGMYSLSTDIHGNVYLAQSATNGVYKMDYGSDKIRGAGAFGAGTPLNFAFDRSNKVVYHDSDSDALYYLTPNYGKCRVTAKKTKTLGTLGKMRVTVTHEGNNSNGVAAVLDDDLISMQMFSSESDKE
ncbi:hypothetical protein MSG28_015753 [Choristoneura fumiferana]|uniref:Uncharacterized protein n=1 Tax=Choristoneura fumiferana TaxID=7141 RepID=A0ACC0KBU8_CHOFU|nr:hypothetical protein MSG28_015753 [Choristoneura fumiferana]